MAIKDYTKKVQDIIDKLEDEKNDTSGNFSRYWYPKMGKNIKEQTFRVRFLPNIQNDSGIPWLLSRKHSFRTTFGDGTYKYYGFFCPKHAQKGTCPFCKESNKLFNSQNPMDEEEARNIYAKKRYLSNLLVIDDPENPENNGKVFLYEYGIKIYEKIEDKLKADKCAFFDPKKGRVFRIKVTKTGKKDEYPNYDKSSFSDKSTPIAETDDEIEEILKQTYVLEDEAKNVPTEERMNEMWDEYINKEDHDSEFNYGENEKSKEEDDDSDLDKDLEEKEDEKEEVSETDKEDDDLGDLDEDIDKDDDLSDLEEEKPKKEKKAKEKKKTKKTKKETKKEKESSEDDDFINELDDQLDDDLDEDLDI